MFEGTLPYFLPDVFESFEGLSKFPVVNRMVIPEVLNEVFQLVFLGQLFQLLLSGQLLELS